jgi:hypothetical protein
MLSELHSLNLKLCSKQYNNIDLLHLIVAPQLSSGWWHSYSTEARLVGHANEQSMYDPWTNLSEQDETSAEFATLS